MSTIKKVQTENRELQQLQTNLLEVLTPFVNNNLLQGTLLQRITLTSGTNIIPTTLNRSLIGWVVTRLRSNVTIYDNQDSNKTPSQNLILVSSGAAVIDLYVF